MYHSETHTNGGAGVQHVFGGDAEACAVVAGGPGQIHRRLQIRVHFLIDGAAKLRPIIPATQTER